MIALSVALNLIFYIGYVDSVCDFPYDLTGIWKHSFHGNLNFNNSTQFLMSIGNYQNVAGKCHTRVDASTYLVVSDKIQFELQGSFIPISVGICLEIKKLKNNLFKLTHLTRELILADYARIKPMFSSTDLSVEGLCTDNTTEARKEYYLLMKEGTDKTVVEECPKDIQGRMNLMFNSTTCSTDIDVCTDKTILQINNTCYSGVAYSNSGQVDCVYHEVRNDTTVLWTHNRDQSINDKSTFLFTCYMISANGNSITATQNPRFCDATQTATTISTGNTVLKIGGASLSGNINYCDITTTKMTTRGTTLGGISKATRLEYYQISLIFLTIGIIIL